MSDYSDDGSDAYVYDSDGPLEDDDDSDCLIPANMDKGKQKMGVDSRALSLEDLQNLLTSDIRRVASITGLEHPIASILLQHFRWNEDRLLEKYMDSRATVLREAGEPQNNQPPSNAAPPNKRARLDTPTEFVCAICFDTLSADEIFKLRCAHGFCAACWTQYVTTKVRDEGQCFFKCMQDGCLAVVDEPSIRKLVDNSCYERYHELLRQSYVAANPSLRFCPRPGCTDTVSCTGGRGESLLTEVPTVQCGKEHAFCFGCGFDSDHRPLICKLVPIWMKSAREDAGTSQWIKANTRMCPQCQNNIEKNGGCNRILCRTCNFQFCWLCMKKWETHGYNSSICNAWQEPQPDPASGAAKKNLEKWLFYFDRYNNHELSSKLDQELCDRTEEKMIEVQETSSLSWIEAKFMQNAVNELSRCRLTLKWSYVMAYFLEQGNQKQIFEDIQADLEKAVEELSQMLEELISPKTVMDLRQRMVDKTASTLAACASTIF
ncbi:hypothetical protein PHLCEN_2v6776 [Hermanssonia centrifuga]|uniref:RBR-type E3 ubiquitin transferase n=1 Tax=Hermanssonia centrifuga TaxID=98765 RepID=A0A2R6NYI2_9APHY|nr:hypothetical protein PHLCEN_2v6776 [Hermanssonia centrifuga]